MSQLKDLFLYQFLFKNTLNYETPLSVYRASIFVKMLLSLTRLLLLFLLLLSLLDPLVNSVGNNLSHGVSLKIK